MMAFDAPWIQSSMRPLRQPARLCRGGGRGQTRPGLVRWPEMMLVAAREVAMAKTKKAKGKRKAKRTPARKRTAARKTTRASAPAASRRLSELEAENRRLREEI